MAETIKEMYDRMIKFAESFEKYHKEIDQKIAKEYKEIHDNYRKIYEEYKRKVENGIELVPTLTFNHLEGMMQPGYRHKTAIERFDEWYKLLRSQNNHKREIYR